MPAKYLPTKLIPSFSVQDLARGLLVLLAAVVPFIGGQGSDGQVGALALIVFLICLLALSGIALGRQAPRLRLGTVDGAALTLLPLSALAMAWG